MKKTFKQLLTEVPNPKLLYMDTILPHIFDTIWDAKTFRELFKNITKEKLRMLKEYGFDTKNYEKETD